MFRTYYEKLIRLDFKRLYPNFISAGIISNEDNRKAQTEEDSKAASRVLDKIWTSLEVNTSHIFDMFLSVLNKNGDEVVKSITTEMISLLQDPNGNPKMNTIILVLYPKCLDVTLKETRHAEESRGH